MSSPNITFMLQYTGANSQFVDYTNRKEAVDIQNEMNETQKELLKELGQEKVDQILSDVPEQSLNFTEYINYMNRSYATEKQTKELTAVFNQEKNHLSVDEVNQLKKNLERAYENGSLLWQGVVSFDNEFLAEQGLYDLATGQVDQAAIKNVLREAMPHLIQREGFLMMLSGGGIFTSTQITFIFILACQNFTLTVRKSFINREEEWSIRVTSHRSLLRALKVKSFMAY